MTIYKYAEYVAGLTFGYIGTKLGYGESLEIIRLGQKVIDNIVGLFFLCIGVFLTHYLKKWLNEVDAKKNKK